MTSCNRSSTPPWRTGARSPRPNGSGSITVLLLGGLDTTRGALTYIGRFLAEEPGLEERLRRPDWTKRDLDELLRFTSTVSVMGRLVTQDNDLLGVPLKAGDRLAVHWRSGNWDEARFSRGAARLRPGTEPARRVRHRHPPVPRPALRPAAAGDRGQPAARTAHQLPGRPRHGRRGERRHQHQGPQRNAPRVRSRARCRRGVRAGVTTHARDDHRLEGRGRGGDLRRRRSGSRHGDRPGPAVRPGPARRGRAGRGAAQRDWRTDEDGRRKAMLAFADAIVAAADQLTATLSGRPASRCR